MRIAFISGKGGASKTTFAKMLCEYTQIFIPNNIDTEIYSKEERELIASVLPKDNALKVFNVTDYEASLGRYSKFFGRIKNVPVNELKMFDCNALKSNDDLVALYDIGADVYTNLKLFEKSDEGKVFFEKLDVIFVPIKYDQDSIDYALDTVLIFQVYPNIKFIFCLTEYIDDIAYDFKNFFSNKALTSAIHFLQASNRARLITVPYSKYIRDSDSASETLQGYALTLLPEERQACENFIKELFKKFDNAFFGFERENVGILPWQKNNLTTGIASNINVEELKNEILEAIRSMSNNNQGTTPGDSNIETGLKSLIDKVEQLKSLEKMAQAFVTPNITNIYDEIKKKISGNTKKLMLVTIGAFAAFPFLLFVIIGYFVGSQAKENNAESKAQNEMKYVNEFSKTMVKSGAANAVSIQYSPDGKTASIVCEESGGLCKNRFDANTNTGYIEIIQ